MIHSGAGTIELHCGATHFPWARPSLQYTHAVNMAYVC